MVGADGQVAAVGLEFLVLGADGRARLDSSSSMVERLARQPLTRRAMDSGAGADHP
jgi:hypothetical protein